MLSCARCHRASRHHDRETAENWRVAGHSTPIAPKSTNCTCSTGLISTNTGCGSNSCEALHGHASPQKGQRLPTLLLRYTIYYRMLWRGRGPYERRLILLVKLKDMDVGAIVFCVYHVVLQIKSHQTIKQKLMSGRY